MGLGRLTICECEAQVLRADVEHGVHVSAPDRLFLLGQKYPRA